MTTYSVIRFSENGKKRVLYTGLSLEEAQAICSKPGTSGTKNGVRWFLGFTKE